MGEHRNAVLFPLMGNAYGDNIKLTVDSKPFSKAKFLGTRPHGPIAQGVMMALLLEFDRSPRLLVGFLYSFL